MKKREPKLEEQEIVARELFRIQHPDIKWGHTGTIDDESWRRFEQKCLNDAQRVIGILKEQAGYVRLAEDQSLPSIPREDIAHIILERDGILLKAGFRRIREGK